MEITHGLETINLSLVPFDPKAKGIILILCLLNVQSLEITGEMGNHLRSASQSIYG